MEQGQIIVVKFNNVNKYLEFIVHCFINFLISGVHVHIARQNVLFLTIAALGIDRIDAAIKKFEGERIL